MLLQLVVGLATALLSSVLTLALAWWLYQRRLRPQIEADIDARIEELGKVIEERVRQGTLDAIASIPSPEVLRDTTRTMTRTGVSFLEALLGTRKKDPDRDR